jgi:hypothetical protein
LAATASFVKFVELDSIDQPIECKLIIVHTSS